jgi:hypothetical protein
MNDLTTSYFSIEKADRQADGTLMVYGKATDDSIDIDQQICDAAWLDRAMPDWFKSGGNIREQHSSIAAGVAKEYEVKADGHYIHALVVDPISVKKVENGVLKGFSIGIKSPRVVRDTKAVNGRIIDGQIVEVSLVDRPANPNAKLMLAKSVDGESSLVQVEELVETDALQSNAVAETKETPVEKSVTVAVPKSIVGDILKFDKAQYEAAREALANLIAIEAGEMREGHNEIQSIGHLLEAVAHLHAWYEGEEAEGEVVEEETIIERSADAEKKDKMCAECNKSYKMCKCEGGFKAAKEEEADAEKGAEPNPVPSQETYATLAGTVIVPPTETPKSAEADEAAVEEAPVEEAAVEETPAEAPVEEAVTEDSDAKTEVDAADVEAIVEQVVKSATESLRAEIATLVAAKEAALEKSVSLESELAIAKSLAVAGGPSRTAKPLSTKINDNLTKAAIYKAKANATTDPVLAKGYKVLAEEFYSKAADSNNN